MKQVDPKTALMSLSITLPLHGDINAQENPKTLTQQLTAADWREGIRTYFPRHYPNSKEHNQGFAKVLQDGVSILLTTLPQPTKLPDVFNY